MKKPFCLAFLIILIYSCSPKIGSTIISKQTPLSDTSHVLVLQQTDSFTNDGIEIGAIRSGDKGLSINCSYFEVIENLKSLARENGANIIKITEHKSGDAMHTCDRIKAKIYKVPDFKKHERKIEWSADRKLTWDDFKGSPSLISNTNIAAQTYCGFSFQTNRLTMFTKTVQIYTVNTFSCYLSSVRPDQKNRPDLLEHEQSHFDLCEVYTRQLRKELIENKLTVFDLKTKANAILKQVSDSYWERQEAYDRETNHGLDRQRQIEWTRNIEMELRNLSSYTQ